MNQLSSQNTKIGNCAPGMVVKVRVVLAGCIAMAIIIALPLFIVWKQSQLSHCILERKELADSLGVLRRDAMKLSIAMNSLEMTHRIQRFAQDVGDMDFPKTNRMLVVNMDAMSNVKNSLKTSQTKRLPQASLQKGTN